MDRDKYPHLIPVVDRIEGAQFSEPPAPWRSAGTFAAGGLTSVGFAPGSDLLLVVSWSGRGVFDCVTGQRVARDADASDQANYDRAGALEVLGIGPLAGQWVRTSGLNGGGLPRSTADGWSVEWLTLDWPEDTLLLLGPGSSIYETRPGRVVQFWKIDPGVTEVRAWGFSPTGRTLLLATSSDVTFWIRDEVSQSTVRTAP